MKIITSHERTDMDALASIHAASLLYPDYVALLPAKLNRNVARFAVLYGEALGLTNRQAVTLEPISDVLLVDTQAIAPIKRMNAETRYHIIDHHQHTRKADKRTIIEGDAVGANTTLLIEQIRERGLDISSISATLMLLGIYEDTGSLSYLTTTARDVRAAAWLMEEHAALQIVQEFMHHALSAAQREVYQQLLNSSRTVDINGHLVLVASIHLDEYVDELSSLVNQLLDTFDVQACFMLCEFEGDVQIIARSIVDEIDVGSILTTLGGGGHTRAAAALAEGSSLTKVEEHLNDALEARVEPPLSVASIMSTNVHTLSPDMTVGQAVALMRRYGHEGFPVVRGDQLVGILTRSDIDRAVHHGLTDLVLERFIHTGPIYVEPQDTIDIVRDIMLEHNLGQVPVVQNGHFAGIVTRTDLIKLQAPELNGGKGASLREKLDEALPPALADLLIEARNTANDMGYSLYIVGGFVRDLVLGAPTLDLDLVVEGDAIAMARRLGKKLDARIRTHSRFGTAKVILDGNRAKGVPESLDFVTARTEFYERPTELPRVEYSSIKQDLYRRDFTINTMAICLDRDRYGELLDYYSGLRDIRNRRIRVLHSLSFVEDPTRILRAVRFEQRLGFEIEERSEELISDALDLIDDVSGERLRHELYLILGEKKPEMALVRLHRLGVLARIHPSLTWSHEQSEMFARLRQVFAKTDYMEPSTHPGMGASLSAKPNDGSAIEGPPSLALSYLALFTSSLDRNELGEVSQRLHISQRDLQLLHQVSELRDELDMLQADVLLRSQIYHLLQPFSQEARFVISALCDSSVVQERLNLYEKELGDVEPVVDGHYLQGLGIKPGPVYGIILGRIRDALLDQQVTTPEEQQALAHALAKTAVKSQAQ